MSSSRQHAHRGDAEKRETRRGGRWKRRHTPSAPLPVLNSQRSTNISQEQIRLFVQENLLKNHNIAYFPDSVEGAIYENVITIVLSTIESVLASASIQVMGHTIKFDLKPNPVTPAPVSAGASPPLDGEMDR